MITLETKRACPEIVSLTSYVIHQGWVYQMTMLRRADQVPLWNTYQKDGYEIYIPLVKGASDYEWHCSKAIKALADYEKRDSLDVYNDIVGAVIAQGAR